MKARFYTDGACSGNPGPGGWAVLVLLDDFSFSITGSEEETTNNRMELKAVIVAFQLAVKLDKKMYEEIEVCSDSAYVVNAIEKSWITKWKLNDWQTSTGGNVKNKDLWIKLMKNLNDRRIRFIKVKGHSDDVMNNKADKLAKKAVKQN